MLGYQSLQPRVELSLTSEPSINWSMVQGSRGRVVSVSTDLSTIGVVTPQVPISRRQVPFYDTPVVKVTGTVCSRSGVQRHVCTSRVHLRVFVSVTNDVFFWVSFIVLILSCRFTFFGMVNCYYLL